ncbi:MAG: hypothetical protein EA412_14470 [Chitinophagaceae bacterium]|nr:MAG: hypothetical protein EA412_14470 [Chitinophagaceae bacterium]
MLRAGTSKKDITAFKSGVGMMGYGMYHNRVKSVETPLFARAVVFEKNENLIVFVNAELCFISTAVKRGVIKKLSKRHPDKKLTFANVMLTAQHTHSGPGGYTKYGFYNLTIPGFVPFVYQTIVDGISEAISEAINKLSPCSLGFSEIAIPEYEEVAFNRSIKAYNSNKDVEKIPEDKTNLAVDRNMQILKIFNSEGKALACINWFGVHTTNISNDNTKICSDNKGYAADFLEKHFLEGGEASNDFVAIFAQESAGDVTPNFIWDKKKKWTRGKFEDDFESAAYNGQIQFNYVKKAWKEASEIDFSDIKIDYVYNQFDFTRVFCDPEFTEGILNARTSSPAHGVAFYKGTKEGPGMPKPLTILASMLANGIRKYEFVKSRFQSEKKRKLIEDKYKWQGNKQILSETGEQKILGTSKINKLIIPSWADPTIRILKKQFKKGSLSKNPWIPRVLPLQIFLLGPVAIVGIPAEITVVGGRRLRKTLLDQLQKFQVQKVILSSYANAYCGYITTFEEYEEQAYEGGHTVYGKYTLAAFQTKFKELSKVFETLLKNRQLNSESEPAIFPDEEIAGRTFSEDEI